MRTAFLISELLYVIIYRAVATDKEIKVLFSHMDSWSQHIYSWVQYIDSCVQHIDSLVQHIDSCVQHMDSWVF